MYIGFSSICKCDIHWGSWNIHPSGKVGVSAACRTVGGIISDIPTVFFM